MLNNVNQHIKKHLEKVDLFLKLIYNAFMQYGYKKNKNV